MTGPVAWRYAMLVRVREFGLTRRDRFPDASVGGQAFATVAEAVARLSAYDITLSSGRERRAAKTDAKRSLLIWLKTIARTASAIAVDTPGFDDGLRLPERFADPIVLAAAQSCVRHAESNQADFIAHGFDDTFLADLRGELDRFEHAVHRHEARRSARVAARAGIQAALLSGLAAVRKLDVIVSNRLRKDPVALAAWAQDRRVEWPKQKSRVAVRIVRDAKEARPAW